MIKKEKNIVIDGKHNKPIVLDYIYKKNNEQKQIVILCHGYKGYKDWGAWNLMADYFAEENFFFIKFNFSHNGGTPKQPIDFPDLEAFGNNNFIKELDDLESVINFLHQDKTIQQEINLNNITVIGHSRGGGIALLKANEDSRIKNVISFNGISDIEARMPKGEALEMWKKTGIAYIQNSRTKQQMPHKYQFYENFMDNKNRLNIKNAIQNLTIPFLIVQGKEDTVVKPEEAKNMKQWQPTSELFLVENMNHAMDSTQPWTKNEMPENLKIVSEKCIDFIRK